MITIVLLVIAAVLILSMVGVGTFFVLVQLGVIAQKSLEPPTSDSGTYSLEQGREVGKTE